MTGASRWSVRVGLLLAVGITLLAIAFAGGVTGDSGTPDSVVEPQSSGVHISFVDAPSEIGPNEKFKINYTLRNYNETDENVGVTLRFEGNDVNVSFPTVPANGTFNGTLSAQHDYNESETFNWSLRVEKLDGINRVVVDSRNGTTTVNGTNTSPEPTGPFIFPNQAPINDNVTIQNVSSSGQNVTVIVTYPDNGSEIIAGLTNGTFNEDDVTVSLGNKSGVPGDHMAYKVATADLSTDKYQPNDTLSATTKNNAVANDSALVGLDVTGDGLPATSTFGNETLLNDIDGDGEFDIFDVQALYTHLHDQIVQNNPLHFGFDSQDTVTIFDVQELFSSL